MFFGLHLLTAALGVAAGLIACSALTFRCFARMQRTAGFLLLPHLIFTLALFYLNAGFWWLNGG